MAVVPGLERLRGGARRPRREAEQEAGYTSSNSGTDYSDYLASPLFTTVEIFCERSKKYVRMTQTKISCEMQIWNN